MRQMLFTGLRLGFGAVVLALVVGGCASSAPSALMMSQAEEARAAIARATEAGALEHAPLLLRDAEDKIREAEALYKRRGGETSRQLLEAARVDAELAEHTARTAKAQASAVQIEESIRVLREETARANDN